MRAELGLPDPFADKHEGSLLALRHAAPIRGLDAAVLGEGIRFQPAAAELGSWQRGQIRKVSLFGNDLFRRGLRRGECRRVGQRSDLDHIDADLARIADADVVPSYAKASSVAERTSSRDLCSAAEARSAATSACPLRRGSPPSRSPASKPRGATLRDIEQRNGPRSALS